MIIQYKNYQIRPGVSISLALEREVERTNDETGVKYMDWENVGYYTSLETCVKMIIFEELRKNESVVTLQQFKDEWKKEFNEVKKWIPEV